MDSRQILHEIMLERDRQVQAEGFSEFHDDHHIRGELPRAAAAYCVQASYSEKTKSARAKHGQPPSVWPQGWDWRWWKPGTRRRDLIKAAALIVAEIQRLDRGGVTK